MDCRQGTFDAGFCQPWPWVGLNSRSLAANVLCQLVAAAQLAPLSPGLTALGPHVTAPTVAQLSWYLAALQGRCGLSSQPTGSATS